MNASALLGYREIPKISRASCNPKLGIGYIARDVDPLIVGLRPPPMNIPDALKELGALLGIPELALNSEGTCRVVFDDALGVSFESVAEGRYLHLSSVIADLEDTANQPNLLETLLHANLLGLATGGAHFSLDEGSGEILFERALEMELLDATGFVAAIESFVNHLEGWQAQLASGCAPPDTEPLEGGMLRI